MSVRDITVIITSFRSGDKIKNCLNSIDGEIKVLLIENSNDSNIKKNIEKEFSNVECILTGANFGYGKSNNIGLKKVITKYALILNPDTSLHPTAIENFIKTKKEDTRSAPLEVVLRPCSYGFLRFLEKFPVLLIFLYGTTPPSYFF